jgi:hypothetical protein
MRDEGELWIGASGYQWDDERLSLALEDDCIFISPSALRPQSFGLIALKQRLSEKIKSMRPATESASELLLNARHQLGPLYADQKRQPLRALYPRVHLVFLACLNGVLRECLNVGPRLGHLLAYLRPCCVAANGNDVWAIVVGLVHLEILRSLALH